MHALLAGLALLVAANTSPGLSRHDCAGKAAKKPDSKKATTGEDPNTAAAKAHGGKVWILPAAPPNVEGEELVKWLSTHAPGGEVTKKSSEERWPVNFLAVFKKPPAKGPLTVEFMDKKEPGSLVDQYSTEPQHGELVFQEPYDLDTNNGFNKGHTYLIKVGQIINKKFTAYATGEVSLK
jgi:hypothetical protein